MSDARAYLIYGAYASMVYGTPIIGGIIADKYIGQYRSIIIGAILIALGHFVMIIPNAQNLYFFIGLSLVIVGTGLFKPSIGAITGTLFEKANHIRNQGFTLLYVGMNIGTIVAPIVCSYIAITISWNLAFGVAGIGMLIGLAIFILALCCLVLFIFVLLKYPLWAGRALYLMGMITLVLIFFFIRQSNNIDIVNLIILC